MSNSAVITNIQQFSAHDGPGIRTTVFLKGCSLSCKWCANPENIHHTPELMYRCGKCLGCGRCIDACENNAISMGDGKLQIDRKHCVHCGKCAAACCTEACSLVGETYTVDELMAVIEKDRTFYETSGGGVTFSGGEPLLFPSFLSEVTQKCAEEGIHIAIETCGNVPWKNVEAVLPYVDLFLYDIKIIEENKHISFCGMTNQSILENFTRLCHTQHRRGKIIVRIPIIFGINDGSEDLEKLGQFILPLTDQIDAVHCLPYHDLGLSKYDALGVAYEISDIEMKDDDYMMRIKKQMEKYHPAVQIGG